MWLEENEAWWKAERASRDHIWVIFQHKSKLKLIIHHYTYVNDDRQQHKDTLIFSGFSNHAFFSNYRHYFNGNYGSLHKFSLLLKCKMNHTYISIFLVIKYLCLGEYLLYCLRFLKNKCIDLHISLIYLFILNQKVHCIAVYFLCNTKILSGFYYHMRI